ncbi:geranylgeranylglycerol-phosphate geranylgeranyltransferase [Flavobacterium sp.]|uniref:geranylgeranylglycerol-phosphate geranylgeranyltransferase n=1 Tax=Flavobacterium sp. TaxID=239 RepID=UPI00261D9407|nr:geranylgeranylglycerol-phosphate geranylgeranyltransferase [Flavobacterium sp.]MDD3004814.1 geranylgeranylglycerol-phosphate geranylgeranyltransferase [Flavobacterium sp.]
MAFLKLIRYQNLLLLILMQLLFRYGFLNLQNIPLALNDWQYAVLILSTICIAAAGYIINNIFDQETDSINKKQVIVGHSISEGKAYNLYIVFNVIGVLGGFYLSNVIEKPGFALLFIILSGTLYLYASSLKQSLLIGNLIVALLTAISVVIIGVFDLYPVITPENRTHLALLFQFLLEYALFAFLINFIREIVKDMEDIKGDYNQGMNTLPIALGVNRTSKIVLAVAALVTVALLYYVFKFYFLNDLYFSTVYAVLTVIAPLIVFCVQLNTAKNPSDFKNLSFILKLVLLFGILSVLVNTLNIYYNVQ